MLQYDALKLDELAINNFLGGNSAHMVIAEKAQGQKIKDTKKQSLENPVMDDLTKSNLVFIKR